MNIVDQPCPDLSGIPAVDLAMLPIKREILNQWTFVRAENLCARRIAIQAVDLAVVNYLKGREEP